MADEPVTAAFLRETRTGRVIHAYLRCIDFDCVDRLRVVQRLGGEVVPPLLWILDQGLPPEVAAELPGTPRLVRERVIAALGATGDARAVPRLAGLLADPEPVVRAGAATALGHIGGDQAFAALVLKLGDPDDLVREQVATALQRLGRADALPALRRAAETEPRPHVRRALDAAIRSLAAR